MIGAPIVVEAPDRTEKFESLESVVTPLTGFAGARRPPPAARWSYRDASFFEICARRFPAHTCALLDAPPSTRAVPVL
jgi:hypothetical protein